MKLLLVLLFATSAIATANDYGSIHPAYQTVQNFSQDAGTLHDEEPEEPIDESPIDPPDEIDMTFFDWARGRDGTGYCYEFYRDGSVANNGRAMPNRFCEEVSPSYYEWARGRNGYLYCYQFTPYHLVMNQGRPVPDSFCRY